MESCQILSEVLYYHSYLKKDDKEDIANYRPISLTNVDYRILAFVLARRLQRVIDSILSHDQTAYVRNRHMGYNMRLVEDVIEYYEQMQKRGIIFMADFTKAFDSLEWDFMYRSLEFFNFGPSIEILGLKIKQQDELKGLNLGYPNKLVKTVQYADDCIAFLNNKNELCTVLNLIGEYGKASGLKLNLSKCEGICNVYQLNLCNDIASMW